MSHRLQAAFRIIAAAAFIAAGAAGWAKDLQVYTEENPPFSYTKDGKVTGYVTEIVEEIAKRIKADIAIEVVPWARAYQAGQGDANVMIYAAMRIQEREHLFKWVGPLTTIRTSFYGKKGGNVKIASFEEAKKIANIGVPRKFYAEQFLLTYGFTGLDSVDSPATMMKKFLAGRNQVIVANNFNIETLLKNENAPTDSAELLFTFMPNTGHYLAFSLKTPDSVIIKWLAALVRMKNDGTFAKIHEKWMPGKPLPL